MVSTVVFYSCVYSLVADPAQQHELISANLKPIFLYPVGFCHGKNKFLITTEASPPHCFVSHCLFLFIGTHQHNVPLPTAAGFVGYLSNFFSACLYVHYVFIFPFAISLAKHYWYTFFFFYREKINCSIYNWWKKYPFKIILTGLKISKCIWTNT